MSRVLELGADDALLKPVDAARLLASMERALNRRRVMVQATHGEAPAATPAEAMRELSDSVVAGRYDLVFQIGEGGMGVVYLASDRKLGRKVALKRMRPEVKLQASQREKFIEEARIISRLNHPYIVGVHEIVEDGEELYLALDYVDGMPLSQIIAERGRLTFDEARNITGCLCQAIDYAHQQNVLHRDLKPSNIMVDHSGYVKVMDFGLAWEIKATVSMLTQKEIGGTLAYMAPEQHLGRCGRASDLYALGVCFYEMITGELPFKGPDFLAQKERMFYVPPNRLVADLPQAADLIAYRMFAPDPKARVATAAEFYELLCQVPAAQPDPAA